MINIKRILIFTGLWVLFYMFFNFLIPTLKLDKATNQQFINYGNWMYGNHAKVGQMTFEKAPKDESYFAHPFKEYDDDVMIKMLNKDHIDDAIALARKQGATAVNINHAEFQVNVWKLIWLPMILLLSLLFATFIGTPIPYKRALFAIPVGILLMLFYSLFKFHIRFVTEVNRHGWLEVGRLNDTTKYLVTHANTILMFMGISMFFAVFIWIITCFRKSDYKIFLEEN